MTARTLFAIIALAACALAVAAPARAGVGDDVTRMTVYDAGIAQFLEERTVELQPGLNTVEWRSLMPKAYLRTVRVVVDGADVVRQDVTYDGTDVQGQKSPVLHLVIENKGAAGPRRVQVDYLAPGLKWDNDYTLVLEPKADGTPPTSAMLDSWVSVYNSTGADLAAGTVDLVAGDLALLVGDDGDSYRRRDMQVMQNNAGFDADDTDAPAEASAEVGSLSAFTRFTLGRNLRMNANAPVNRFPLFQRARIAVEERKVFENAYNVQTLSRGGFTLLPRGLEVRLVGKNTTSVPMPAGQVTIYARSGDTAQIVGQDRVGLTPQTLDFSVSQGRSSTLLGTRRVVERREVELGTSNGKTREKLVTTVEVVLTNRGTVAADAFVREGIEEYADNKWAITTSSHKGERLSANLTQFKVSVPAGGKTVVTYTVETQ
jgi:hypothetical protein